MAKKAASPAAPRQDGPAPAGGGGPSRGRLFLVDDNPLTVSMLEQFFLRLGFEVAKSTDPAEALHVELPFVPEMVILDAMMPGMSGFEFAGVLKEALGPGLRIVMLTALRSGADRERALQGGVDIYLTKPIKPGELLEAVEEQLRAAREGRAGRVLEELARVLAGQGSPAEKVQAAAGLLAREGYTRP